VILWCPEANNQKDFETGERNGGRTNGPGEGGGKGGRTLAKACSVSEGRVGRMGVQKRVGKAWTEGRQPVRHRAGGRVVVNRRKKKEGVVCCRKKMWKMGRTSTSLREEERKKKRKGGKTTRKTAWEISIKGRERLAKTAICLWGKKKKKRRKKKKDALCKGTEGKREMARVMPEGDRTEGKTKGKGLAQEN